MFWTLSDSLKGWELQPSWDLSALAAPSLFSSTPFASWVLLLRVSEPSVNLPGKMFQSSNLGSTTSAVERSASDFKSPAEEVGATNGERDRGLSESEPVESDELRGRKEDEDTGKVCCTSNPVARDVLVCSEGGSVANDTSLSKSVSVVLPVVVSTDVISLGSTICGSARGVFRDWISSISKIHSVGSCRAFFGCSTIENQSSTAVGRSDSVFPIICGTTGAGFVVSSDWISKGFGSLQ